MALFFQCHGGRRKGRMFSHGDRRKGSKYAVVCFLDCESTFFGRTVVISPFNRKGSIKWLRSMAPMTSVLSGFITTFTFSRKACTYTHTHTCMRTCTRTHTDAVMPRRLLKCNRLGRLKRTLVPRSTIPTCVCSVHFAHGFTAQRKPQNIHPDDGVK